MRAIKISTALAAVSAAVLTGVGAAAATTIPSGTTPVSVSAGAEHTGIDAGLQPAGAIAGTITSAKTGNGIASVAVTAINTANHATTVVYSQSDGSYSIKGLRAGGYSVCTTFYAATGSYGYVNRCLGSSAQYTGTTPAPGATTVHVSNGQLAANRDIALPDAGAIAGAAHSARGGGAVGSVLALAYQGTRVVGYGLTGAAGTYRIAGLAAGAGYHVCFIARGATGGGSPTGYLPQCYRNSAWNGATVPSTATGVTVHADRTTANVNAALAAAGAIAGSVKSAAAGHPGIGSASVTVYLNGHYVQGVSTTTSGAYRIAGLPAGTYRVCAIGGHVGSAAGTFGGRCWHTSAWTGGKVPSAAAPISVRNGATHAGVDLQLPPAGRAVGAIAGTVTAAGSPLDFATVTAYNAHGVSAATVNTASDGTYTLNGLAPGTYRVCFDPYNAFPATGSKPSFGYAAQCFQGVAWGGAAASPVGQGVSVTAGATHKNVDAAITNGGAISGTVTRAGTSTGVPGVRVLVFNAAKQLLRSGSTDSSGGYTVPGVTPNAGGYTVCFAYSSLLSYEFTPSTGYLNQCYANKDWTGSA